MKPMYLTILIFLAVCLLGCGCQTVNQVNETVVEDGRAAMVEALALAGFEKNEIAFLLLHPTAGRGQVNVQQIVTESNHKEKAHSFPVQLDSGTALPLPFCEVGP